MSHSLIKANLNLYAVLTNLEDLVKYDEETKKLAKDWDISIQFLVKNGPKAYVQFKNGVCTVGKGKIKRPKVKLFFTSPDHLNRMFEEDASPIPLKGFTKLGFLTKDFPKVTDKLEYYLKPTDELLQDEKYMELNTRFTINTAAFAIREIGLYDPTGKNISSHIMDGTILMQIEPEGPKVNITFEKGDIIPEKGNKENPMAALSFKNLKIASDFLLGKSDTFTEVATGNVSIRGRAGMLDAVSLILDRIPLYLT